MPRRPAAARPTTAATTRTAAAASASSVRSNDRPPRVNGGSRGRPLLLQALPACPAHLVKHEGRDSPSSVLPEVHPMRMLGACQLDMEATGVQLEKGTVAGSNRAESLAWGSFGAGRAWEGHLSEQWQR